MFEGRKRKKVWRWWEDEGCWRGRGNAKAAKEADRITYGREAIDWAEKDICSRCEDSNDIVVVVVVSCWWFGFGCVYIAACNPGASPKH